MPPTVLPTPPASPAPPMQPRKTPVALVVIMIIFAALPVLFVVTVVISILTGQAATLEHAESVVKYVKQSPHVKSATFKATLDKFYGYSLDYTVVGKEDATPEQVAEALYRVNKATKSQEFRDYSTTYKQLYRGKEMKLYISYTSDLRKHQHNIPSIITGIRDELNGGMTSAKAMLDYNNADCFSELIGPKPADEAKSILIRPLHSTCALTSRTWKNSNHELTLTRIASSDDLNWLPFEELFSIATKPGVPEVSVFDHGSSAHVSYGLRFVDDRKITRRKLTDYEKTIAVQFIKSIRSTQPKSYVSVSFLPPLTIKQGKVSYSMDYRTADGDEVISRVNSDL